MNRPLVFIVLCFSINCLAQDQPSFSGTVQKLYQAKDSTELHAVWNDLIESDNVPFVVEDSVAFLYHGKAKSVSWLGDFNDWGYTKELPKSGKRIRESDLWILKISLPKDARIDYKIVIDEMHWILDPHNPDSQWSGVGGGSPNSELRMPDWKPDPLTASLLPDAKHGKVEHDLLVNSKALGYQVMYNIYLPADYNPKDEYPVIYVTDGYEYMHERMGNMITILDNLIHLKKIKPIIAIFIDNREPVNRANNRRIMELALNEKYLIFLKEELIPAIENNYKISPDRAQRAILGTSVGGLAAAYFAFSNPEVFGLAGIQSPAFWFRNEIYTICDNPENPPVKIFMTSGAINDRNEGARKMKAILEKNTCTYHYVEVNQGHSWGNWRDLTDDILIYFFPAG